MIDEKMLQGIKTTLNKIDEFKKQECLGELLSSYSVDITVLKEHDIVDAIVKFLLSDNERFYYNQYTLYLKQRSISGVSNVINSLNDLTTQVEKFYEEKKEASEKISHINDIVRRIKIKMHDVPLVRISTLYHHLENDYNRYSKATIKAGMDESRMSDTIYNIEHGSFLLRQLKTKELVKLKKELAAYKEKANAEIDERHEKYIRTREEYTDLLRNVIMELLRDDLFLNASLLSVNLLSDNKVQTEEDYFGIERVTKEDMKEASKKAIIDQFFIYFEEHNHEQYDAKTFARLLENFILHFYTVSISRLEGKKNKCLAEISKCFLKQKEMMGELAQYQDVFCSDIIMSKDETDTMSLVYKTQNK